MEEKTNGAADAQEAPLRSVEHWAAAKRPPRRLLAAARAGNRWAVGFELTETDFDAALTRAAGIELGQ